MPDAPELAGGMLRLPVDAETLAHGLRSALFAGLLAATALVIAAHAPAAAQPRTPHIAQCAACHGEDGIARQVDMPHLAGQNEVYLYNQIMAFRSGRRQHREMRYMAREISEAEVKALAAYYASLPPR
jgi:cytochrome c553